MVQNLNAEVRALRVSKAELEGRSEVTEKDLNCTKQTLKETQDRYEEGFYRFQHHNLRHVANS